MFLSVQDDLNYFVFANSGDDISSRPRPTPIWFKNRFNIQSQYFNTIVAINIIQFE